MRLSHYNSIKIDSIYKLMLCLYCLMLVCRAVLQATGGEVFVFLAVLFTIPLVLLILEILLRLQNPGAALWLLIVSLFYLLIIPMNVNGIKFFMPLVYAALAFRNVDYKFVCKTFLIAQIIDLVAHYFLVNSGVLIEQEMDASWKSDAVRKAYDLGYGNTNTAGMALFFLWCILHVFLYERSKFLSFVLILCGACLSYYYTISRTAFLACLVLLISYFAPVGYLMRQKFFLWGVPFFVCFPLLLVLFSVNTTSLDSLMSGRFYYILYLIKLLKEPSTLITGLFVNDDNIFPIDNVFSYLLVYGGVIAIVLFFCFYGKMVKRSSSIPPYVLMVLLAVTLSGIGESSWAVFGRIGSSFFWLLLLNRTALIKK